MKRFQNILCVVDTNAEHAPALKRAVALAISNQAKLRVVAVAPQVLAGIGIPEGGPISENLQLELVNETERALAEYVKPFAEQVKIEHDVLVGVEFLETIREVLRNQHDLVVKTPEDPDWFDRLFGSDDMHLLRKCPCPVWLTKQSSQTGYKRIMASVDVEPNRPDGELDNQNVMNLQILQMASSLALAEFAELHIAHAWEAMGESAMRGSFLSRPTAEVDEYVARVKQQHEERVADLVKNVIEPLGDEAKRYLQPTQHLVKGSAKNQIPELVEQLDIDLIVMGTVARTGVPGFLIGNTAETILGQIDCSVLAIKPPGFVSPVVLDD